MKFFLFDKSSQLFSPQLFLIRSTRSGISCFTFYYCLNMFFLDKKNPNSVFHNHRKKNKYRKTVRKHEFSAKSY